MDSFLRMQLDSFEESLRVVRTGYVHCQLKPQAKQSTRWGRGHAHTSKAKRKYMQELAKQVRQTYNGPLLDGLIRVTVIYSFPWRKKDTSKTRQSGWMLMPQVPDIDNLLKPFDDSMQGHCYADDSRIVEVRARKMRSDFVCIAARLDEVVIRG
jgi:Holliday junction resolvase RusA-like endonuclease